MSDSVRIDKWLWSTRFFKTRSMAAEAVSGGKVHLNGQRVKPAKPVHVGDQLEIRRGYDLYVVEVLGIISKRSSAKIAQAMYVEQDESRNKREEAAKMRKITNAGMKPLAQRPSGKQRGKIRQFNRNLE